MDVWVDVWDRADGWGSGEMKRDVLLLLSELFLGLLFLFGIFYKNTTQHFLLFWLFTLTFAVGSFVILVKTSEKYRNRLMILIILLISIGSVVIIPQTYQLNKDGYFEVQYARTIISNQYRDVHDGLGFAADYYGYNPGIHFVMSLNSLLSGISVLVFSKWILWALLKFVIGLLAFMIIQRMVEILKINPIYSYFSTLIFCFSSGLLSIAISRRSVAAIFLLIIVYFLMIETRKNIHYLIIGISTLMVIIADHSVSYLMMGVYLLLILAIIIRRNVFNNKKVLTLSLVSLIGIILILFLRSNSGSLLAREFDYIVQFFQSLVFSSSSNPITNLPVIESWFKPLITRGVVIIFYLFSLFGMIKVFKKYGLHRRKGINETFITALCVMAIISFPILILILNTPAAVFSQPLLWFMWLILSIFFVYGVIRILPNKLFHILILLVFVIGSLFLTYNTSDIYSKDFMWLENYNARNDKVYFSGEWLALRDPGVVIDGDPTIYDIYIGISNLPVTSPWWASEIYKSSNFEEALAKPREFKWNNRIVEESSYFVTNQFVYYYPSYYLTNGAYYTPLYTFDMSKKLDSIYNNNQIQIRRINN